MVIFNNLTLEGPLSLNLYSFAILFEKQCSISHMLEGEERCLTLGHRWRGVLLWEVRYPRLTHYHWRHGPLSLISRIPVGFKGYSMKIRSRKNWQIRASESPQKPCFFLNMHFYLASLSNDIIVNNLVNDLQCLKTFMGLGVCNLVMFDILDTTTHQRCVWRSYVRRPTELSWKKGGQRTHICG